MLFGAAGCALAGLLGHMMGLRSMQALCVELAVWNFLLGLGMGGEYPVAAAYIVEQAAAYAAGSARPLAGSYLHMGLGQLLASLMVVACLSLRLPTGATWRLSLILASLLALATFVVRVYCARETQLFIDHGAAGTSGHRAGLALACSSSRHLCRTLFGTSSSWFLLGFAGCGLNLRSATTALMHGETGMGKAVVTLLATLMGLPGYVAACALVRYSRRICQLAGFVVMALLFAGFAIVVEVPEARGLQIALYAMLEMASAGGAGATAHFVPAEVFPTCVRSSCLGLSALAGGLGTAVGSALLPELASAAGPPVACVACTLACGLGAACTALLTPRYNRQTILALAPLGPGKDVRECTLEALERGAQFKQCPSCEVMVEREGGCNVITCVNCQDVWCFACGGRGCRAWMCSGVEVTSPDLETMPRLLWPGTEQDRSVPLVVRS